MTSRTYPTSLVIFLFVGKISLLAVGLATDDPFLRNACLLYAASFFLLECLLGEA